jgi:hypothetical protein
MNFTIKKCPTHCERCNIEFEENNPAGECPVCDCPTICNACAEDHGCCKCSERLHEQQERQREWERELELDEEYQQHREDWGIP